MISITCNLIYNLMYPSFLYNIFQQLYHIMLSRKMSRIIRTVLYILCYVLHSSYQGPEVYFKRITTTATCIHTVLSFIYNGLLTPKWILFYIAFTFSVILTTCTTASIFSLDPVKLHHLLHIVGYSIHFVIIFLTE